MFITFFDSFFWIPTVMFYLPEKLIINHHPGTTGMMMLKMNESPVTKLFAPARQTLGDDMCMDVDFEHEGSLLKNCSDKT
ncbi:MAG: hypothetical protein D6732_25390 [Methanobacteriota archaeon]|nr:MAG: hypothetical protein D6732_25390 [Euryarchaeota archaeon]